MREKVIILKDITQTAFLRCNIYPPGRIVPDFIAENHLAFIRHFQPRQHADDRGLTRPPDGPIITIMLFDAQENDSSTSKYFNLS